MNPDDCRQMDDALQQLSQLRKYEEAEYFEGEMRRQMDLTYDEFVKEMPRQSAVAAVPRPAKASRYSPHQGAKELARAARRAKAGS
jgi:hypothetical protein